MRILRTAGSVPQDLNAVLGSLPAEDYQRMLPSLELARLERRTSLHRQGEPIEHVYFPGGGLCSLATRMADGETVVVAIVGREGLLGAPVLTTSGGLGIGMSMVHVGCDDALRLPIDVFRTEVNRGGALADAVARYSEIVVTSIVQTAACNRVHTLGKRLPCWLLVAMERLNSDSVPLTHEMMAMMLGVRRASLTLAANALQDAGLIRYRHGKIQVVDSGGLESASCECYLTVRNPRRAAGADRARACFA